MPNSVNLEHATESTLAKAVTRYIVPALLTVVGTLIAWLINDMRGELTEISSAQSAERNERQKLAAQLQLVDGKVDLMNSKVDNGLIWRITELERRVQTVESAARTP